METIWLFVFFLRLRVSLCEGYREQKRDKRRQREYTGRKTRSIRREHDQVRKKKTGRNDWKVNRRDVRRGKMGRARRRDRGTGEEKPPVDQNKRHT